MVMKRKLILWSLVGAASFFNIHGASAAATFEPSYVSNDVFENSLNTHINAAEADDEIASAIQALSAKSQQKEDSLSSLASKISKNPSVINEKIDIHASAKSSFKTLSNTSAPAIAASVASRAAHAKSTGRCAMYVRKALQAAGYQFTPNASAYQYATNGTLAQAGFVKISNNTPPQIGDVVVYNRSAKHRHGHIQIYDGTGWVSDFRQEKMSPYSGSNSYTTWRDARYLNDASDKGIYLALADE